MAHKCCCGHGGPWDRCQAALRMPHGDGVAPAAVTETWARLGCCQRSTTMVTWGREPCRALGYVIHPWMWPSRAWLGRAGDKIKPLLMLNPAWTWQHHHRSPPILHTASLAFCFPFCPRDKVRMPKPLVQHSSGIWVSFSSLPQENFKLKKITQQKKKK